jgi:hypothetical protein
MPKNVARERKFAFEDKKIGILPLGVESETAQEMTTSWSKTGKNWAGNPTNLQGSDREPPEVVLEEAGGSERS